MSDPNIQFYTLAELEEFAEIFIGKFHNPPDSLPVEIDLITERNLGVSIIDYSMLKEKYGLEAFLALGKKTIYIDQDLMDSETYTNRYRFTVAEEVSHRILHGDLFKNVEDVKGYFAALDKIKHFQLARMDKDAKYLASAILMPTAIFTKLATDYVTELNGRRNVLRYNVVSKLSKVFEVSLETASIRFEQLKLDRLISDD